MHHPPKVWDGVLERLRTSMPPLALEAWILPLVVEHDEKSQTLRLHAPGDFHEARVRSRHLAGIETIVAELAVGDLEVVLSADGEEAKTGTEPATTAAPVPPAARPGNEKERAPVQAELPHSFDTFIVGPENALAREASLALAQQRQIGVSPLFLAGPSGCGKSHLARALLAEARPHLSGGVVHVSAEHFTGAFTSAVRRKDIDRFKQRFRDRCQLLVIEDVQFFEGKQATQLEFFHTLEHLVERERRVVLTGDRLPREMHGLHGRLISQITSGLVAELEPPGRELRRRILKAKAAGGGVRLPDECLDLLVERAPSSVRDLEGVLIQLVASAALLQRPIDTPLTEAALRKVVPNQGPTLTLPAVVERVGSFFGLSAEELASRSRRRSVLVPRQIAIYLCHRYTSATLTDIGRAVGRDLPAVKNAIQVVERAILERAPLRYQVEALVERLGISSAAAQPGPERAPLRVVREPAREVRGKQV
jgi:chromosomal replication initiator protein